MKKKWIILVFGIITSICVHAQIKVTAPVVPNRTTDQYPTHYDLLGYGGYMSFRTKLERDNLPRLRRKAGMMAYVVETDSTYILENNLTNWIRSVQPLVVTNEAFIFNGTQLITKLPLMPGSPNTAGAGFSDPRPFIKTAYLGYRLHLAEIKLSANASTTVNDGSFGYTIDLDMYPSSTTDINVAMKTRIMNFSAGAYRISIRDSITPEYASYINIPPLPPNSPFPSQDGTDQPDGGVAKEVVYANFSIKARYNSTGQATTALHFLVTNGGSIAAEPKANSSDYQPRARVHFKWASYVGFIDAADRAAVNADYTAIATTHFEDAGRKAALITMNQKAGNCQNWHCRSCQIAICR